MCLLLSPIGNCQTTIFQERFQTKVEILEICSSACYTWTPELTVNKNRCIEDYHNNHRRLRLYYASWIDDLRLAILWEQPSKTGLSTISSGLCEQFGYNIFLKQFWRKCGVLVVLHMWMHFFLMCYCSFFTDMSSYYRTRMGYRVRGYDGSDVINNNTIPIIIRWTLCMRSPNFTRRRLETDVLFYAESRIYVSCKKTLCRGC